MNATASQIKSFIAAAITMLAIIDANTLNLLSELLTPTWGKVLRLAVIFAGLYVTGNNQSWSPNHMSLPRGEAEALADHAATVSDPLARKAVRRITKEVK